MIAYDNRTRRYIRNGKPVSNKALARLIDNLTDATKRQLKRISRDLQAGEITVSVWKQGVAELLKDAHVTAASVGRGGIARMTRRDWRRVQGKVRWQYGYLNKFAKAVRAGRVVNIASRAATYANALYISFAGALRESQIEKGNVKVRLITNSKEGCDECAADEAEGWVEVDEMKELGERECGDWCRCELEFSDEVATENS